MNRAMDHPDWAAFVEAIVANPDDDTARLVAADFLEENGDADRAAFIRVQVELARLELQLGVREGPEVEQLRAKERGFTGPFSNLSLWAAEECPELVKMRGGGGRSPLEAMTVEGADKVRWRRGFIDAVNCSTQDWDEHYFSIRKRLPIEMVSLTECHERHWGQWRMLLPSLRGLRMVWLWESGIHVEPTAGLLRWLREQLPQTRVAAYDTSSGDVDMPPQRPQQPV